MEAFKGFTPLHVACLLNNVEVAKSLLLYTADVNCLDKDGATPLLLASHFTTTNGMEMILLLLKNNASVNLQNVHGQAALHFACKSRKHTAVEMLLRHGADPNIRTNINVGDTDGWTPLHYACLAVCQKSVQMLLDYHADTNCQDSKGNTPLHLVGGLSVGDELVECLRKLLEHNADLNIKNDYGETPLLSAVQMS